MGLVRAYLGVGSNIGDRWSWLSYAVKELPGVHSVSPVYKTEPVGGPEQAHFFNIVVAVDTSLDAYELLETCLSIEAKAGRKRGVKNGPRILDIDILLYGDEVIQTRRLTVPHPRMNFRNFVITPLLDVYPEFEVKGFPSGEVENIGDL